MYRITGAPKSTALPLYCLHLQSLEHTVAVKLSAIHDERCRSDGRVNTEVFSFLPVRRVCITSLSMPVAATLFPKHLLTLYDQFCFFTEGSSKWWTRHLVFVGPECQTVVRYAQLNSITLSITNTLTLSGPVILSIIRRHV